MIEITPSATSQRHPFLPPVVRRRRRRSLDNALDASRQHRHHEKHQRIADRQRPLATLHPWQSSLIAIPIVRRRKPATLKSP